MPEIRKNFEDFCGTVSLHGYAYLVIVNAWFGKLIWGLIILTMSIIGMVFLFKNTKEYIDSRLTTTIESSTASVDVKFFGRKLSFFE